MQGYDNGLDDSYGLLYLSGDNNSVISNHISENIDTQYLKPSGIKPVIIRVVAGKGNFITSNHIVATTETSAEKSPATHSCFDAQVGALLTVEALEPLDVTAVQVEKAAQQNTVLDSGTETQVVMDRTVNAFRATPAPGV